VNYQDDSCQKLQNVPEFVKVLPQCGLFFSQTRCIYVTKRTESIYKL